LSHGIELDNAVMAGFADVTFAIHLCRGNQEGRWLVEGHYEPIARPIFQRIGDFLSVLRCPALLGMNHR
jgi:5-methyltetrahydropteroyltriglutamate--homocysteine methyltransferase